MRDPHLGILAEDAIDRRRLCTHGQDAPPAARVRQRGRSAQQRVERRYFKADQIAHYREDVRSPAPALLARQDDVMDAI